MSEQMWKKTVWSSRAHFYAVKTTDLLYVYMNLDTLLYFLAHSIEMACHMFGLSSQTNTVKTL